MLVIDNISKTFAKGTVNEKVALCHLSLTLEDGDYVTVIGSNGAGKSTLMNAISGTWTVDEGKIIIDDVDVTHMAEHKRAAYIGRVFQDPLMGTAADMWIEENLAIAAQRGDKRGFKNLVPAKKREFFYQKLAQLNLGLEERLSTKVGLLSGGQRQALTLMMASLKKPKLLLLDEHTAALDPATAKKVLDITDTIVNENHLTTLMITHNMQDAIDHGNRLIMLDHGKIILDIKGDEKKNTNKAELIKKFAEISGEQLENDAILLSR